MMAFGAVSFLWRALALLLSVQNAVAHPFELPRSFIPAPCVGNCSNITDLVPICPPFISNWPTFTCDIPLPIGILRRTYVSGNLTTSNQDQAIVSILEDEISDLALQPNERLLQPFQRDRGGMTLTLTTYLEQERTTPVTVIAAAVALEMVKQRWKSWGGRKLVRFLFLQDGIEKASIVLGATGTNSKFLYHLQLSDPAQGVVENTFL